MSRAREDFIACMLAEVEMPVEISRLIMRDATTIQRLAAEECNRELTTRERLADEAAQRRIRERCAPFKVSPIFSGDPRGACVKLRVPSGRADDWGGVGICVPTRCF
jgi:hypothetical protein